MNTNFEIIFYRTADGTCPVESFLNQLDVKMRNKAIRSLELLETFGNQLREPDSKPIGNGLFELRIQFSNDISRIFYFFKGNRIIVTNGFIKKTRKTPPAEIKLAKKYKDDFERRHVS